ncbi:MULTISPECIES: tryptophan 2,3-dioxygenase [Exiguobacterium]|uniref:Tryptophan 2,3-dioxygenase n=1 Tax=Exiguobacterium sibiricum (strain DSM 17290 / CCUG 55495 / CIP 109462 / JCM 13490 / 255-15) TaxID=262543 RepID=T23O_EXIS2|nr:MULTISPECIES: tryptophan 2,3-dioxygenase [Exiguobacterium]B1YHD4.1 RecName: Full=Tryptophan 2,3-dioxygenase; Short=TDO; AltName: Full=Tryptamin 2,3-dioxygenase; AltName: Full=Tryptophan oxygenase; Short=TO; Short=TRPO; AltName: Full=Tryptophan pyrrolase; AltName: Full=Tryptophanase [Exiguobacterium sibiricum 255-15]ACB59666.1 tryptophan 2,3-dioxygenase [Exiguobacterium sibiricum 255-15]
MKQTDATNIEESIQTDFKKDMSYGDYLQLDSLLTSQQRLSDHHDEMLFIVIHQTSELWMKLILHEMTAAIQAIADDQLERSFKMLARVSKIQQQLIQSWSVLSTLTPAEYLEFRDSLGHSSGFQSYQNRQIEFSLGFKNAQMLRVYEHETALFAQLNDDLQTPSIYDETVRAMHRRGLPIDEAVLNRDVTQDWEADASVEAAWAIVYQDVEQYWDLYELGEKLLDIGSQQQMWRFNHMSTVERIIGQKPGTGGSSGVSYLRRVLDHRFFPELWSVRTKL